MYIIPREAESVDLLAHKYCTRNLPFDLTPWLCPVPETITVMAVSDHVIYSKTLVTSPVATVRPPSRMLNRWPGSRTWG